MALQNFLVLSLCQLLPHGPLRAPPSPCSRRRRCFDAVKHLRLGCRDSLVHAAVEENCSKAWWFELFEGEKINRIIILINNNNNKRTKFRSQTSEHMDKWKSRGGKSQRGEEQKREDQTRERVRRKKMQVREKVGKPRKGRKVGL